jgi:hypothetical protein
VRSVAMDRDARRCRAPHHEGRSVRFHPEEAHQRRLEGWATHNFAFSRHHAPEVCRLTPPPNWRAQRDPQVRAQGMPGVRCTRGGKKCPGIRHRFTGLNRHSLHNGFTVSFVLSLATGLFCHHRHAISVSRPLGPTSRFAQLERQQRGVRTTRLRRTRLRRSSARQKRATVLSRPPHPVSRK